MAKPKRKFDTKNESPVVQQILGTKKRFHEQDLTGFTPANPRQEMFFQKWYEGVEIIGLLGFPGSGKTASALYAALEGVFRNDTPYEKIIIVRSPVVCGGEIGFLPGIIEEKQAPYEAAYSSLVKEFIKYNNPYQTLKELGYLEFALPTFLRGMTFNNSIVIIEECQNYEYDTLYTAITRIGYNSRIILTGDFRQDDLSSKRKKTGLTRLLKVFNNMPYGSNYVVDFKIEDIVRSGIVRDFVLADFETKD